MSKEVGKYNQNGVTHTLVIKSGTDIQWWKDIPPKGDINDGVHMIKSGNEFFFHLDHYDANGKLIGKTYMRDGYKFASGLGLLIAASGTTIYSVPLTIQARNVNTVETDNQAKFLTEWGNITLDKISNTTIFEPKLLIEDIKLKDTVEVKKIPKDSTGLV